MINAQVESYFYIDDAGPNITVNGARNKSMFSNSLLLQMQEMGWKWYEV